MDDLPMISESQKAEVKAERLLLDHLDYAQSYDWLTYRFFIVRAFWRFRTRYFVVTGGFGIEEINTSGEIYRAHGITPADYGFMPRADVALAQKLMLETKPSLLRKACRLPRERKSTRPIAARYHQMKYQ